MQLCVHNITMLAKMERAQGFHLWPHLSFSTTMAEYPTCQHVGPLLDQNLVVQSK